MEADTPFTSRDFRDALGTFPTGVAIVTAILPGGEMIGATVSSFNSVSLAPPLIQFAIARTALTYGHWQKIEAFGVNILNEYQIPLSKQFATARGDKWQGVSLRIGETTGVPLLSGVAASFECRTYARYEGGDHELLLGRVMTLSVAAQVHRPLVFHGGRYKRLNPHDEGEAGLDPFGFTHGW